MYLAGLFKNSRFIINNNYCRLYASYPAIMDKNDKTAVFKDLPGEDRFTLSFHVNISEPVNIDRQFNMCRPVDENLASFYERLIANLNKTYAKQLNKKLKKKKPKLGHTNFRFTKLQDTK